MGCLESGADPTTPDIHGNTPVMLARTTEIMTLLLSYGGDPNMRNQEGKSALHLAKTADSMTALLQAGGDPHGVVDNDGKSAFEVIIQCNP